MADVVVTRADRAEAVKMWLTAARAEDADTYAAGERPEGWSASSMRMTDRVALLIAAARAAERERCAGKVREMAKSVDAEADMQGSGRNPYAPESHYDRECSAKADVLEEVALNLRDLAERIGKGE